MPQTTTGQMPAEMLMSKPPRFRLDLLYPAMRNRVLNKQASARENHNATLPKRALFAGDAVWAMHIAAKPGVLQTRTGPVSFTVSLIDGIVWRRHVEHLRVRIPEEDVGMTLPRPADVGVVPPMEGENGKHHL